MRDMKNKDKRMTKQSRKKGSDELRKEIEKGVGLFMEGLSSANVNLTSSALGFLSQIKKETADLALEDWQKTIIGYSEFVPAVKSVKEGKRSIRGSICSFNPYLGSPAEMLELCSRPDYRNARSISLLVACVGEFLDNLGHCPLELRKVYPSYLKPWLTDLVAIINSHLDELMNDRLEYFGEWDIDGPHSLSVFISSLMKNDCFEDTVSLSFSLFADSIAEAEICDTSLSSPLNTAVLTGNMEIFGRLYAYDSIRNLVHRKNEGEGGSKIMLYPSSSVEMLDYLFSLGILLPGKPESECAFHLCLRMGNPSREMIEKMKHPSYFTNNYMRRTSPLEDALVNPDFKPENLELLVESSYDVIGRSEEYGKVPSLAAALEGGDRRKVDALLSLGADVSWHDRWGNNILHRIYGEGKGYGLCGKGNDYGDNCLPNEKNVFGKTPGEYSVMHDRKILNDCTRLDLNEGVELIFKSSSTHAGADSLFFIEDPDQFNIVSAGFMIIGMYVRRMFEDSDDVTIATIRSFEELEKYWTESAQGDGRYILLVPEIEYLCEEGRESQVFSIIMDLYSRQNVTLLAGTEFFMEKLFAEITAKRDRINIFVSKTETSLYGEILVGHEGTEALRRSELILRRGNDFYLTEQFFEI